MALVIKKWFASSTPNERGSYVHLVGRQAGAFAWFLPGQHTDLYGALIMPEGRIHFAGEHTSLTHTWMQGALESGLRATREILEAS